MRRHIPSESVCVQCELCSPQEPEFEEGSRALCPALFLVGGTLFPDTQGAIYIRAAIQLVGQPVRTSYSSRCSPLAHRRASEAMLGLPPSSASCLWALQALMTRWTSCRSRNRKTSSRRPPSSPGCPCREPGRLPARTVDCPLLSLGGGTQRVRGWAAASPPPLRPAVRVVVRPSSYKLTS